MLDRHHVSRKLLGTHKHGASVLCLSLFRTRARFGLVPRQQQRSRDAVRLDLNWAALRLVLAGWTGFGQCDMQCGCHVTRWYRQH